MRRGRPGCLRWIVLVALVGAILFVFRFEIVFAFNLARTLIQGHAPEGFPPIEQAQRITLMIALNALAILFFSVLLLYWIAGAAFPVHNNQQIYKLVRRILRSVLGRGSALLVAREGVLTGELSGADRSVVLVDLESVIVIESPRPQPNTTSRSINGGISYGTNQPTVARVAGPGLVFLGRGERLRDIVSMRKQVRVQKNVLGQTSDGIELKTNVSAVFTLGQPADVILVAYLGDPISANLRVLQIDPATRKIKGMRDELDEQDKEEIHRFAQQFLYYIEPSSPLGLVLKQRESPPYAIDEQRILAAVYSRARNVSDQKSVNHWTDLPAMVAAEIFHNLIARYTFDGLYMPEDPSKFPLQNELKPEFTRRMRYMGVMAYQFVQRNDGEPPEVDQRVDHRNFRIAAVQNLHGPKVLRERGIKVLHGGFGELAPTDPEVNQQRVYSWLTRWQQEANLILADMDHEVLRIQHQSRLERQQEMIATLTDLFQSPDYSEESLTVKLFQLLEEAASDPLTRQLLPRGTIGRLRSQRFWLLPEEGARPSVLEEQPVQGESE